MMPQKEYPGKPGMHTEYFLTGGGEMGTLTRNYDWAASSLGPPQLWPQSLQVTLATMLSAKIPMFLWWGEDLVQFYNDAYRPSLGEDGKHPKALGQKGEVCWPEIWPTIYPLIQQVLSTGEATWSEDQLIPIYRNGKLEDVYWSFGYSAVRGEGGAVHGVLVICTETTGKVLAMDRLQEKEKMMKNMILHAPVAMCVLTGPEYIVEHANEKMFEFWDKCPGEAMNKPIFDGVPEARDQGFETLLLDVYTSGVPYTAHNVPIQLARNGVPQMVYFNFLYQPLFDECSCICGVLAIVIDVTPQQLAHKKVEELVDIRTQELKDANEHLQLVNNELKEFAYITSHHLQEPLRKIATYSKLLSKELNALDIPRKDHLEKIVHSAASMATLIKDILRYSILSKDEKQFTEVSLQHVMDHLLSDQELLIRQKGAIIEYETLPIIAAEAPQMYLLFGNLLSNALKYSSKTAVPLIRIKCTLAHLPETDMPGSNGAFHKIEFCDNGIGFSEKHQELIFQIFERLHTKNAYEGTGIGLSICKKIVQKHNGNIYATSDAERGTVFTVLLPVLDEIAG